MLERADETQAYRILRTQESKIIDRFRVTDGEKFRLKDYDPADTAGHQSDKPLARTLLDSGCRSNRRNYTPRIVGGCCAASRRWTPPARMARSST
jgi:hypothetical protein